MDNKEFYSNNFAIISKNINRIILFEIIFMSFSYFALIMFNINKFAYYCIFVTYFLFKLSFMHHIKSFSYYYEYLLRHNKTIYED